MTSASAISIAAASGEPAEAFAHVREWVFDLDNTLYCASVRLFDQIDARMTEYLTRLFRVDPVTARRIQKDYFHRYGTTLRGLILNREIADPEDFLSYVHDIDYSHIAPNPELDAALARIEGRKWVFTNGSKSHAEAVLERLGVRAHIDEIFDVTDARYAPKPLPEAFDAFFARTGIQPKHAAMFEDIARNLQEPHARGMVTVLVDHPANTDARCMCAHADERDGAHIHFRTDNLTDFLKRITTAGKQHRDVL